MKIPARFGNLNINEVNAKTLGDIKRKIRSVYRSLPYPYNKSTARDYYDYYKYRGGRLSFNDVIRGK